MLLLAATAIGIRAPFLEYAEASLSSDEAIVGLIANDILAGRHSAFFWGQSYMGTIESYVAAGLFAITGQRTAAVLRCAPLFFFACFLVAHYLLCIQLSGARMAFASTALLAFGPPVFLTWTMRAMAGYMETLLFGTVLLLLLFRWQSGDTRRTLLAAIGFVAGLAWWTTQLVSIYLIAVLFILVWQRRTELRLPPSLTLKSWFLLRQLGSTRLRLLRPPLIALNAVAVLYIALGAFVVVTGGFSFELLGQLVRATDGWKLVGYAARWVAIETVIVLLILAGPQVLSRVRHLLPGILGFIAGYMPVILHVAFGGSVGAPRTKLSFPELLARLPSFLSDTIPLFFGGGLPDFPWLQANLIAIVAAALLAFLLVRTRPGPAELCGACLAVSTVALFLLSGNSVDPNSYRYLLPLFPAVSMIVASTLARVRSRAAAALVLTAVIGLWSFQNARLHTALAQKRDDSAEVIEWLRARDVHAVLADYWIAYRCSFIAGRDPEFAPYRSHDRAPLMTQRVLRESRRAYVFAIGDPTWPPFQAAKADRIIEQRLIGRHRVCILEDSGTRSR